MLMVYPEATTCNSTALLPFKKGAFMTGKPVSMAVLKWDQRWRDPSDSSRDMIKAILISMCGLFQRLQIDYLGDYIPTSAEQADPILYATNVRDLYSKYLGWAPTQFSVKDKFYFFGKNKDFDSCSPSFKELMGKDCIRANGWYAMLPAK